MKKILVIAYLCAICAPMMLVLSTNADGNLTIINLLALAYAVVVWKFYKKIFPQSVIDFLKSVVDNVE